MVLGAGGSSPLAHPKETAGQRSDVRMCLRALGQFCLRLGSAEGEPHEISAGADTQLLIGVAQVELDGSPAQEELSGHVSVGVPAADQRGDLLLLRGQLQ